MEPDPKTRLAEIRGFVAAAATNHSSAFEEAYRPGGDIPWLLERIAHLEKLAKQIQWGSEDICSLCWPLSDGDKGLECQGHHADCPAFTPEGEIK